MFQFLPMECRWIMIGDLNMIESPLDGFMSSCSHLMGWKKELAWANVINKYNIDGYLSRNDGPIFSWGNLQDDSIRVLTRLDRYYSCSSSVQNSSCYIMHYKLLGDLYSSNQHPIYFHINLSTGYSCGSSWRSVKNLYKEAKDSLRPYGRLPHPNAFLY